MTGCAKVTPAIPEQLFQTRIGSVEIEPEPEIDDDFEDAKSPEVHGNQEKDEDSEEFDADEYYDEEAASEAEDVPKVEEDDDAVVARIYKELEGLPLLFKCS